jgi:5,5'-dehydrodivanillate O-demethylase
VQKETNDKLTQVGQGTPMGDLLRRYWQPIGTAVELDKEPVQKVRVFGEDLTLYRNKSGVYGLVGERCPHRCTAMEYGIPDDRGLRCPYHGWLFDETGRCLEQPFDDRVDPDSGYKEKTPIKAYPVQELGGLIFAYLGPTPVPLLPRWDLLVRDDLDKMVEIHKLPCNWLQCMDNAADPVHFEYLHAELGNYTLEKMGLPPAMERQDHLKIEFDIFKYGIMKRRLLRGEPEDADDWTTGHPLLFPNILAVGGHNNRTQSLQFRVPLDDTNTIQFAYRVTKRQPDAAPKPFNAKHTELFNADGKIIPDTVPHQDMLAWVGQGQISDRTKEHLSRSDKGVVLYHNLLLEQMDRIENGEDPLGVIRDPKENEPMIDIRREGEALAPFKSKYSTIFERLETGKTTIGE